MKGAVTFYVAVQGKSPFQAEKPIVCQVYNSSYALNYTFSNGQQHSPIFAVHRTPIFHSWALWVTSFVELYLGVAWAP
uniref:WGS project CBMI000000000 data, contig CS3069_c003174 n=1 Tax=Fusarium clavum TaxID=2594811 RepID=A0A090N5V1_9HYPO|nr:unnamed protein product [Fusarium clavum]